MMMIMEKKAKNVFSLLWQVHVLIAKGTKIFSYGENSLGQCGHNHVSELNRPTAIVSCVVPEDTTNFHNSDHAYRLDVGKIFSGIHS